MEAIKQLGNNGGGFFNANSATPFENPTALTNFLSIYLLLAIPFALTYTFGKMVGSVRHGAGPAGGHGHHLRGVGRLHHLRRVPAQPGGGRRRGPPDHRQHRGQGGDVRRAPTTAVFGVASTSTSTGSADGSYDQFNPIGGLGLLTGMMLGEVTPGGSGSGLYTILIYAIIAVFIGGLMIGRTPEYLGKKIQAKEVKLAGLGALVMPLIVLILTAIAVSVQAGRAGPLNGGPHGFSEILYGLTSQGNNNGSAFDGLTGNTPFYNVIGFIDMTDRPLRHPHPGSGPGRVAGRQERGAGVARHLPHRQHHVHRPHHRRHRDHRRPHLLPGHLARPDRRAAEPREVLLMTATQGDGPVGGGTAVATAGASSPTLAHGVAESRSLFDPQIMRQALVDAFKKFDPRVQVKNPVMFVVLVGSVVVLIESIAHSSLFTWSITVWLFLTVLFANFAEAMAEGRGKAQADTLRRMRSETEARRLRPDGTEERVAAAELAKGDLVVCEANDLIPSDGEIVEGIASVDESAITGESAPVIRESGGDRSAVTGGTKVLSDRIVVRITAERGQTFFDRMITLVEGANRQKTPNEIALTILLAVLTIVFLPVVVSLQPFGHYAAGTVSVVILVSLLVCLIPTTIGALLSAIGIAGMDRLVQKNVLAMSGRAVEAAGDVQTLLLDKTGTITLGNRMASDFFPVGGHSEQEVADVAQLASLADETPEGRSIVVLAKERFNIRERQLEGEHTFVPFSATTRMSGLDLDHRQIRKGAAESVKRWVTEQGGTDPAGPRRRRRAHLASRVHPAGGGRRPGDPRGRSSSRTWSRRGSRSGSPRCGPWASAR